MYVDVSDPMNSIDLCNKHGVDGYPQMNLYRDGQFVETYTRPRELDMLREYLSAHAEPTSVPSPTPSPTPLSPVITSPVEADEVPVALPPKVYNHAGIVTVLNEKTFWEAVQEGHMFVKFYAPWYVISASTLSSLLTR